MRRLKISEINQAFGMLQNPARKKPLEDDFSVQVINNHPPEVTEKTTESILHEIGFATLQLDKQQFLHNLTEVSIFACLSLRWQLLENLIKFMLT